jgi:hypothetical protein
VVKVASPKHSVYIFNCNGCVVQVGHLLVRQAELQVMCVRLRWPAWHSGGGGRSCAPSLLWVLQHLRQWGVGLPCASSCQRE